MPKFSYSGYKKALLALSNNDTIEEISIHKAVSSHSNGYDKNDFPFYEFGRLLCKSNLRVLNLDCGGHFTLSKIYQCIFSTQNF